MGTTLSIDVGMVIAFLFFTVLAERITEQHLKIMPFLDHRTLLGIPSPMLVALFWAIIFSWGASLNFFAMLGLIIFKWAWVGVLVTTILMTGGSNLAHSIIMSYLQVTKGVATDLSGVLQGGSGTPLGTAEEQVKPQTSPEQGVSGVPPDGS